MTPPRVLAVVQAGGAGARMDVLTRERAKPALPFGGIFQLVDFPLSNLAHSGVTDVWLQVQYHGASLQEQVANGRPWDLDRTRGGLRLLMPEQGTGTLDEEGFARGNADGLFRIRDQIGAFAPEVVLTLSADHVYRLDLREVVATHLDAGAECTVVTSEVPLGDAGDHLVCEVDRGRVTGVDYKPADPIGTTVATEVFAYDPDVLIRTLDDLHRELSDDSEPGDTGLGDFGDHLLPRLVAGGRVVAHPQPGYWRDLGQPHKYLAAHHDLLVDDLGVLSVPDWPILTQQPQRVPARVLDGGRVTDSLLSPGCRVWGTVRDSVLGPGVVVEKGAEVDHCVLFTDVTVRGGARVAWSVVDTRSEIGEHAAVGDRDVAGALGDSGLVTLIGRGSTVGAGVRLAPGARLEPGTTA